MRKDGLIHLQGLTTGFRRLATRNVSAPGRGECAQPIDGKHYSRVYSVKFQDAAGFPTGRSAVFQIERALKSLKRPA